MKPLRATPLALFATIALSAGACHHDNTAGTPPPSTPAPQRIADGATAAEPGAPPPGDQAEPSAPPAQFTGTAQYLPQGTSVQGWRQSGDVRHATPHDLFQIMDGEAASYEQYGVRDYASAEYRAPQGTFVTQVQVYEFGDALGAFGRYSLSTSDGRDPATLQPQAVHRGGGGFMGSTELDFWKGNHLVQVSLQDAEGNADEAALTTAAHDALPRFAEAIDRALPGATDVPPNPLPAEGMVWGGATYLADSAFGAEHTGPAWVGFYRTTDGKRYRLGVLARPSLAEAQRAFTSLRASGATAIPHLGDEAFAVSRTDSGELVVARRANTVFVIADGAVAATPSPDRAAKIALARTALALPVAAPAPSATAEPAPSTAPATDETAHAAAEPSAPDAAAPPPSAHVAPMTAIQAARLNARLRPAIVAPMRAAPR